MPCLLISYFSAQICTRTPVFIIPKFFMAALHSTSLICVLLLDNYTIKLRAQEQFILSKRICILQIMYGVGGTFLPTPKSFLHSVCLRTKQLWCYLRTFVPKNSCIVL